MLPHHGGPLQIYEIPTFCQDEVMLEVRGGHSIAPKTTSANAASASP